MICSTSRVLGYVVVFLAVAVLAAPADLHAEVQADIVCYNERDPELGCAGLEGDSIMFDGRGSTGANTYTWEFGDGTNTSQMALKSHKYMKAHNPVVNPNGYVVTLTVEDQSTPPITDTETVFAPIENVPPTAISYAYNMDDPETHPDKKYDDVTVRLEEQPSGGELATLHFYGDESFDFIDPDTMQPGGFIWNYAWDFDWNESPASFNPTSYSPSPTKSYLLPGDFTVGLRVRDDDGYPDSGVDPGESYTTIVVHVLPTGPWAKFTKQTDTLDEGDSIEFYDASIPSNVPGDPETLALIVNWEWDFDYCGFEYCFDPDDGQTGYTTVSRIFNDARPYTVALRVTDDQGRSNLGAGIVVPENIQPVSIIAVTEKVEPYIVIEGIYTSEDDEIPHYLVNEGETLRFDGSIYSYADPLQATADEAAGEVSGYGWDWNYPGFGPPSIPPANLGNPKENYWLEDTDTLGGPYRVCLRVRDDDHTMLNPSEDLNYVDVFVLDVPPSAAIRQNLGEEDFLYSAGVIDEGQTATFEAADGSFDETIVTGNQDELVKIEWDFSYEAEDGFQAELTKLAGYADFYKAEYSWGATGEIMIAVRITDDDNDGTVNDPQTTSLVTFPVTIGDFPPRAKITPSRGSVDEENPNGPTLTVLESETAGIFYSAEYTDIGPTDILVSVHWDDYFGQAGNNIFNPSSMHEYPYNACVSNICERFDWKICYPGDTCPTGRGLIPPIEIDGGVTNTIWKIAVCCEDDDNPTLCQTSPEALPENQWIYVLNIEVENVAPNIDGCNPPTSVAEGGAYSYIPCSQDSCCVDDISADQANLTFTIVQKPPEMDFDPLTGGLVWTPGVNDVNCLGNPPLHPVRMYVEDDDGGVSGDLAFTIGVSNINDCPEITACDIPASVIALQEFNGICYADDLDFRCGDHISFYLENEPEGMAISSGGVVTWTPPAEFAGRTVYFDVCVEDDDECYNCASQSVEVLTPEEVAICDAGPDQELSPGLICQVASITSNPGDQQLTYHWSFVNGPVDICLDQDSASTYPAPPKICFATNAAGDYTLECAAENQYSVGPTDSAIITVVNVKPGAVVGGDRNYRPGATIALDGSRSGDYNDDAITFNWGEGCRDLEDNMISGDCNGSSWEFATFDWGIYELFLVTADQILNSAPPKQVLIEVLDVDVDTLEKKALPFAFIAEIDSAEAYSPLILDGSASTNRMGSEPLTFEWRYLPGSNPPVPPEALIYDNETEPYHLEIDNLPEPGIYHFGLTVSFERAVDGDEDSEEDTAVISSREFIRAFNAGLPDNEPPRANAGDDEIHIMELNCPAPATTYKLIELDGSLSSDQEQMPLSYRWSQVDGIEVPLIGEDSAEPSFYAFHKGLYTFKLVVYDGIPGEDGVLQSDPDEVHIVVTEPGQQAPTAFVSGLDFTGTMHANPGEEIALDASLSSGKPPLTHEWRQIGGPSAAFDSWNEPVMTFRPDITGVTYIFRLVVWNGNDTPSLPLDVMVHVNPEFNSPPNCVAAEPSLETHVCIPVVLDGGESDDLDAGDVLHCHWELVELGAPTTEITLENAESKVATFTTDVPGDYRFKLYCFDGSAWCNPAAEVAVKVHANIPPTADAGPDQSCVEVGGVVQLEGSGEDRNGHELSYEWSVDSEHTTMDLESQDLSPSNLVADPTFQAFDSGVAVLDLVVCDCQDCSDPDEVWVSVQVVCPTDGDYEPDGDDDQPGECVDNDHDGYYVGPDYCQPRDYDDDDENCWTASNCGGGGRGSSGGGGDCRTAPGGPYFIICLAFILIFARRRRIS